MVFNTALIGFVGLVVLVPLVLLVLLFLASVGSCIRKKVVPVLPQNANAFQHMNEEEASDANGPAAL